MEITPEIAQTMIDSRFHEHPQMKAIVDSPNFRETLAQILDFSEVDRSYMDVIENEITVILALYAPLRELAQNIAETTGLPKENSENIASLIETLILQPVINDLRAYDYLWQQELLKETSTPQIPETSPDQKEQPVLRSKLPIQTPVIPREEGKPLTREEVLNAITSTRTMQNDITSLQGKNTETEEKVVRGYEAYQKIKDTETRRSE